MKRNDKAIARVVKLRAQNIPFHKIAKMMKKDVHSVYRWWQYHLEK